MNNWLHDILVDLRIKAFWKHEILASGHFQKSFYLSLINIKIKILAKHSVDNLLIDTSGLGECEQGSLIKGRMLLLFTGTY